MEKDFILIRFFFCSFESFDCISIFFCHSLSLRDTYTCYMQILLNEFSKLNLFLAIAIIIIIISGSSRRRLQFSKFLFAIFIGFFFVLFCFRYIFLIGKPEKKQKRIEIFDSKIHSLRVDQQKKKFLLIRFDFF